MRYRHCPNCDGEVIVYDADLQADKCMDCGEHWRVDPKPAQVVPQQEYPEAQALIKAALNYVHCKRDTPYWFEQLENAARDYEQARNRNYKV